jgi:Protein of unknown function (DUF2505)
VKIDSGFDYPGASLDAVFAMLTDPDFQRERCAATGALESTIDVTGDPAAPIVRCRRRMATHGLPDFVRKIVGSNVEVTDDVRWLAPDGAANRTAQVGLSFAGQPTKLAGALYVHTDGSGTHGKLAAELKAGIPFVGGRIEKAIAPLILKAMASEQTVGRQWLSR